MNKIKSIAKKVVSKLGAPLARHKNAMRARDAKWKSQGASLKSGGSRY